MPCLLLANEALVKTVRFANPSYLGDPINAVRIYNEMEVDELVFLDISASVENRPPPFKLIGEIASECFMPLSYGGGVRSLEDIRELFRTGVEKVAINSHAEPEFIREAAERFGSQSILVSMDVKRSMFGKYSVRTHSGTRSTRVDPAGYASRVAEAGAGELLLTSIDRDGTWDGYDVELIRAVSQAVDVPVIACGCAGNVEHFREAVKLGGASAVAAGSMFVYQGRDLGVLINFPARGALEEVLG